MDVTRLRALRELADRGTVTAAAAALHRTPSAVSQQIRALSAELGVPLTEPAGRGLRLTDAGRVLVRRADEVIAAAERAEADLDVYRTTPRGRVRLAVFPSGGLLLLAGVLRRTAAIPGLAVLATDIDMRHAEAPGLLADHDVVVTHYDEHAASAADDRTDAVHLLREPLDVALPPGHPLGRRRSARLAELAAEPWISPGHGLPVDEVLISLAARTGVRPRVVQRINDFAVTEQLVAAGIGVALLPRHTTDWSRLARLPLSGIRAARHIEALVRREAAALPGVAAVLSALRAEAARVSDPAAT